jgi:hypothetical protein
MTSTASLLPEPLLVRLISTDKPWAHESYCAGFEVEQWRCTAFADHMIEWIADYALREDELDVNHGNMYVRLKQAAVRVYATDKYAKRGEFGEIALHAICRSFFDTIPLAPRVFYKTSSNDVVKSFDMAHVRYLAKDQFEIWLGESKFYKSGTEAIASAVESIKQHVDAGFLRHEKLLLGPQVSKNLPHADAIRRLLASQTSLDALFSNAVFPVCIACDSNAIAAHKAHTEEYLAAVLKELVSYRDKFNESGLPSQIRMVLIHIPLGSKDRLAAAFDLRLKGLVIED